jgi:phosphatidylserine decarboxylase
MHLHREGYRTILIIISLFVLAFLVLFLLKVTLLWKLLILLPFFVILLLIVWFFRVPVRTVIVNNNFIYAPADGKIVAIEETTENEYFHDRRVQISIFMSPLNMHQNTYPVGGTVVYIKYHKGSYLVAWHPKSSLLNERSTVVIQHPNGNKILVRQIAGAVARRIRTYSKIGDKVEIGDELGFIKFGSRVDILLPISTKIICRPNQITRSKSTILAEF